MQSTHSSLILRCWHYCNWFPYCIR